VKYGLPPHEANDVFQATCMELLTRLADLREPRALPKWLMQVAHHECYRWKKQQQRVVSRDADPDLPEPETPPMAESLVQQTQEEQMLREALGTLTPQCRKLVELLFFETPARPYAEIAKELGLALGSIGFTRQKCMDRLRRRLDVLGFS
jgi:RNA polymerase sigma factor (sigma-70 family)